MCEAEWQPIEAAPKDGSDILVLRPSAKRGDLIPQVGVDYWSKRLGNCWAKSNEFHKPLMWMPLPPPPRAIALAEKSDV